MATWEQTTLDKLGIIKLGIQKHKPKYDSCLFEGGRIPFIQMWCVNGQLYAKNTGKYYNEIGLKQSRLFPENTVCITNDGRVADASILKFSACLSDKLWGFNSFEKISDNKFIKYCFNFSDIKKSLRNIASAGEHPILTLERLLKVAFPKPSFELQKKIGKILSSYDFLIENYQRQIEEAKKQVVWEMIHTS